MPRQVSIFLFHTPPPPPPGSPHAPRADPSAHVEGVGGRTNAAMYTLMVRARELPRRCGPHSLSGPWPQQCLSARWQRQIHNSTPPRALTAVTVKAAATASEVAAAADPEVSPTKRRARKAAPEDAAVVKRKTTRKPAAKSKGHKAAQPAEKAGLSIADAAAGTGLPSSTPSLHAAGSSS